MRGGVVLRSGKNTRKSRLLERLSRNLRGLQVEAGKKKRKTRSNKGKKRAMYRPRKDAVGITRSGRRYRAKNMGVEMRKKRKTRSNKGVRRRPYGKRTGKLRSGKRFR